MGEAIRAHLRDAADTIRRRTRLAIFLSPFDWYRGTSLEQAYRSLHAARVFLVELVAEEDVDALVPGVLARVQSCLPATDPQRIELENLPNTDHKMKRAKLVRALERGYAAHDEAHADIRRFRNVLLCAAALITFFTFLFVHLVAQHPTAVPLCFKPDITTAQPGTLPAQQPGSGHIVCPSGEQGVGANPLQPELDVWIVAGLGLLGGGLASAVSVRKMARSTAPYDVPLALALLKVPMGALTAVAGILLLGGGFVPGFSQLDTQRQILAYALIFGYAQQLATRYLDDRATTLLAEVPGKRTPLTQSRSLPPTDTQHLPGPETSPHAEGVRPVNTEQTVTNASTPPGEMRANADGGRWRSGSRVRSSAPRTNPRARRAGGPPRPADLDVTDAAWPACSEAHDCQPSPITGTRQSSHVQPETNRRGE